MLNICNAKCYFLSYIDKLLSVDVHKKACLLISPLNCNVRAKTKTAHVATEQMRITFSAFI